MTENRAWLNLLIRVLIHNYKKNAFQGGRPVSKRQMEEALMKRCGHGEQIISVQTLHA